MIGKEKGSSELAVCLCVKGKTCWQGGREKPAGLLEHSGGRPARFYATGTV